MSILKNTPVENDLNNELLQLRAQVAALKSASMFDKAHAAEQALAALLLWAVSIERRLENAGI